MGRMISRAESWQSVYKALQDINFAAFDYSTVKQSLIDYFQLYHPEFNNYIETDEFIMDLEAFAYIAELFAYRLDVTAHENLFPLAQRKDSILQLAKLISYTASRNLPARGLVKLTSITTSEPIIDSLGNNLANTKIVWNDITNPYWKEQFILVMNHVLISNFGTVIPTNRIQVYDQIFELYQLNNIPISTVSIPYNITVAGTQYTMELVSSDLNANGPFEQRPERNINFSILYGSDGLGDNSNSTGFFMLTKQGTLLNQQFTFDGVTPNQTLDVTVNNINETDVWVNNIDPATGNTLDTGTTATTALLSGQWVQVDSAYAENIIFNTITDSNKYEIETLTNDNIRIIFGDGEFANIPSGLFEIWYRVSANADLIIPPTAIYELSSSLAYIDSTNNTRNLTFTFSSIDTIQNSAPSEDIEHIRRMAPAVYYTQNRMVSAKDYNSFLQQDQTILKLFAVNRSFAGQSPYAGWYDASGTYSNVKIFGDDLSIYFNNIVAQVPGIPQNVGAEALILNYVQPLLSLISTYTYRIQNNLPYTTRRYFTPDELHDIIYNSLGVPYYTTDTVPFTPVFPIRLKYGYNSTAGGNTWLSYYTTDNTDNNWLILIDQTFDGTNYTWTLSYQTAKLVVESPTTNFYYANSATILNYDSLTAVNDTVTILKANLGNIRTLASANMLPANIQLNVLGSETYTANLQDTGIINPSALNVATIDANNDGWPDLINLPSLINNVITLQSTQITLPYVITTYDYFLTSDVTITGNISNNIDFTFNNNTNNVANTITIVNLHGNTNVTITINDYVYFYRADITQEWQAQAFSVDILNYYVLDTSNTNYSRLPGRSNLNFLWTHFSADYNLIDPNTTNIIDIFVITRGYYLSMRRWLDGTSNLTPVPPTSQELGAAYNTLLTNKMISDSVVVQSGILKIIFGTHAAPELQATLTVVPSPTTSMTSNQIKTAVVQSTLNFFSINDWDFGQTFNFTELAAKIHYDLQANISTVVLVPLYTSNVFGDLFQINVSENEIVIPDITVNDVNIVTSLNSINIRQ